MARDQIKGKIKEWLAGSRSITIRDIEEMTDKAVKKLENGEVKHWMNAAFAVVDELY